MLGSMSDELPSSGGPEGDDPGRSFGMRRAASILGSVILAAPLVVWWSRLVTAFPWRSVSSCAPMRMRSPTWRSTRAVIRLPLTSTPFRLWSSIVTLSSVTARRACLRETSGSSSDSWQVVAPDGELTVAQLEIVLEIPESASAFAHIRPVAGVGRSTPHGGFGEDTGIPPCRQSLRESAFMPSHDSYLSAHTSGKSSLPCNLRAGRKRR